MIYVRWSISILLILLDFDHWLHLSDILKTATKETPDVAIVWFMQWAKMALEHGEKDRYWCIV